MHFVNAKGILNGSGGQYGMNVYRGCTHGCVYCDSRSRCYHFTHPFEDVEVKQNAPELLEKALKTKRRKCVIGTGSMSDPYMHCEEELHLTPIEYKLLCVLARHCGKVLTHKFITQQVWGAAWETNIASLRVFMATLRRKLETPQSGITFIQTHVGIGYRMIKADSGTES